MSNNEGQRFAGGGCVQRLLGMEDVVELTPAEARAIVPGLRTDDLSAATFCPSDGLAGPNEVTYGYANAARRLGALILENTPLDGFITAGGAVRGIRTGAGEIACTDTVICAGPWSAAVGAMLDLALPIEPSPRQVFVTEPFVGIGRRSPM